MRDFFIQGIGRWTKAYEATHKSEEAFRDDYDPMKPDSGRRWASDRFAATLKDMRCIHDLNQEELAEKAGLSLFILRSYEQGKRMPYAKQMEALCEALGATSRP